MKKILVLCDDIWHPAEVIEKGLEGLQDEIAHFDFVRDAKDILTVELLKEYPLIMNCKSDNLTSGNEAPWFEEGVTEVGPKEFEDYVRTGGGLLSVHAGNTYHEDNSPEYAQVIGNRFVTHPPRCEVHISVLQEHAVTKNVENFTIRDEHYEIELLAEDAEVLLQSESESGGVQTAGYVRTLGEGRICVLTPGHILSVWRHPMFRQLLTNAIRWCMKESR
ncbi:MAG: ThuA domain-containing protein [Lachnospiraceae bacterium]|nr:ThuA domain-containing protein [Lachnospiraceae bacterium]